MITFQYFEGCPNADKTLKNVYRVMKELDIPPEELVCMEVPDLDSAKECFFQGSPTILINGIDIYTQKKPHGYSFSCRIYEFDTRQTGVIPANFIKERLVKKNGATPPADMV